MMCSPMKRACETAAAIAALLGERVELNTNLCEVGGIYAAKKVMRNALIPSFENVPGVCPSSSDLRSRYPNFDSPTLPASGPWDGGRGHESVEQAISRSQTLAHWLKSEDLQSKVGNGMLVRTLPKTRAPGRVPAPPPLTCDATGARVFGAGGVRRAGIFLVGGWVLRGGRAFLSGRAGGPRGLTSLVWRTGAGLARGLHRAPTRGAAGTWGYYPV